METFGTFFITYYTLKQKRKSARRLAVFTQLFVSSFIHIIMAEHVVTVNFRGDNFLSW